MRTLIRRGNLNFESFSFVTSRAKRFEVGMACLIKEDAIGIEIMIQAETIVRTVVQGLGDVECHP